MSVWVRRPMRLRKKEGHEEIQAVIQRVLPAPGGGGPLRPWPRGPYTLRGPRRHTWGAADRGEVARNARGGASLSPLERERSRTNTLAISYYAIEDTLFVTSPALPWRLRIAGSGSGARS